MKTRHVLSLMVLALLVAVPAARAQSTDGDQPGRGRQMGPRGPLGDLNLTDEQKARLREAMKDARQKVLNEILTDAQREQLEQERPCGKEDGQGRGRGQWRRRMQRRKTMADELNMTEQQRDQARAIMQAARQKVHDTVLTDEQREQLEKARQKRLERHLQRMSRGLNLSEAQQEQARAILTEAHEQVKDAEPGQKHEVIKSAHEKIINTVLNDEQRAKAKKFRQRRRQRHGDRQDGPSGRPEDDE